MILILLLPVRVIVDAQVMTLEECIRMGMVNNIALLNARIDMEKEAAIISQNRAKLLPVINGVLQFTDYLVSPVNVTSGTLLGNDFPENPAWQTIKSMPYNANAGVLLSVPVYNQAIFASIDVARTIADIAALSYDKAMEDLTVQIGRVYYLAQGAQAQARLLDRNVARMEDLYTITEAMYEQGTVMETDLNRVNINLQNLKASRDQCLMLYGQRLNMLRFLIDLPPETPLTLAVMADTIRVMEASGLDRHLPELILAHNRMELAEKRIKAVKAGYLPSVTFTAYGGGIGYQEKFGNWFRSRTSSQNWFGNCFIGLSIHIPIFDANARKLQIKQYRYDFIKAENQIDLVNKRLREEYDNAILQLNHNYEVCQTQSKSLRQAENVYSLTETRYMEGVASMTELLQDEMQLRTAQSLCVDAHCRYNIAQLELMKLSGTLSQLSE